MKSCVLGSGDCEGVPWRRGGDGEKCEGGGRGGGEGEAAIGGLG